MKIDSTCEVNELKKKQSRVVVQFDVRYEQFLIAWSCLLIYLNLRNQIGERTFDEPEPAKLMEPVSDTTVIIYTARGAYGAHRYNRGWVG